MKPSDRLLLAFYVYGPSTYAEMSEYLGWLRSRLSIANQVNVGRGFLDWTRERTGVRWVTKRFTVTEAGIDHLKFHNFPQVRDDT